MSKSNNTATPGSGPKKFLFILPTLGSMPESVQDDKKGAREDINTVEEVEEEASKEVEASRKRFAEMDAKEKKRREQSKKVSQGFEPSERLGLDEAPSPVLPSNRVEQTKKLLADMKEICGKMEELNKVIKKEKAAIEGISQAQPDAGDDAYINGTYFECPNRYASWRNFGATQRYHKRLAIRG